LKLKDCPFCGSKASLAGFVVGCPKCATSFDFDPYDEEEKNKAIEKWNTRNDS
jgi:hypothetical protein